MLCILDYEAGNQTSVRRALDYLDIPCVISSEPDVALLSEGIIFPGVGAAGQAMVALKKYGLDQVLVEAAKNGKPILGICLGCQILLEYSQENETQLLGILKGQCLRFPEHLKQEDGSKAPIPHMGWNSLNILQPDSPLLYAIPQNCDLYFVHSFYVQVEAQLIIANSVYGQEFCAIYGRDALWGVQCHLEKSGKYGLQILQNFYHFCSKREPFAIC